MSTIALTWLCLRHSPQVRWPRHLRCQENPRSQDVGVAEGKIQCLQFATGRFEELLCRLPPFSTPVFCHTFHAVLRQGNLHEIFRHKKSSFKIFEKQKSQRTLATNRRSGWLQTLPYIAPSEERLASSGLASRHIRSLLNGGGDLLQAHEYHMPRAVKTV